MNIDSIFNNFFLFEEKERLFYKNLNIKKINLWGFINKKLTFKNKIYYDIQSYGKFDSTLSKIVLNDEHFFYTIYLNSSNNRYLNNFLFLHRLDFYKDIAPKYELLYDKNGIIGFKIKKLNLITKKNLNKIKKKTDLIDFYRRIIVKQKKFNIIMADIHYVNCGYDENNKVYLFDIDSYVDGNLFNNNIERKEIMNMNIFWLLDRGYKMFNSLIDEIFENTDEKNKYYLSIN